MQGRIRFPSTVPPYALQALSIHWQANTVINLSSWQLMPNKLGANGLLRQVVAESSLTGNFSNGPKKHRTEVLEKSFSHLWPTMAPSKDTLVRPLPS